jgi:MoxR-like ATPase
MSENALTNQEKAIEICNNISKVIVGKDEVIQLVLTSIIAGGHILLEDVPGTGKTMLAKSFAKSIDADFCRIQFTPDLLPSDVTGINYYNQKVGEFVFRKGPILNNIILADEINRATPRTQSALLECMEEHQVTVDGNTYELEPPFIVIATQNPIETAGTYQLPEAQLDRFLMKIHMGYPEKQEEVEIINRFLKASPLTELVSVCTKQDIIQMMNEAKNVYVHPEIMSYVVDIVEKTRKHENISIGVSTRGTITMINAARAYAYIQGRSHVVPEDIVKLSVPVFAHRLVLAQGRTREDNRPEIIRNVVNSLEVPTEEWNK